MPNYKNSVIYKICCKNDAIKHVYVGSTVNPKNRKSEHKRACNKDNNRHYNYTVYRYIRDHGGWKNWEFVLLEKFPCKDKQELIIRERYWFELLGAKLNSHYPQRDIKEYNKEYYSRPEVKEREKIRRKEYRSRPEVKEYQKEYHSRPEAKERAKELSKEYHSRPEVKERVKEYHKKTYTCLTCNKVLKWCSKWSHEKTKTHLQNLEKQQQEIQDSAN